jgi:pyridoxamine 5'-phosphate oxidase family protein
MPPTFTAEELAFLRQHQLGRLATVDASGAPQNNPVGLFVDAGTSQILVGGFRMGQTRKFRNVKRNANVAVVVDELTSTDPWVVAGVEVRGTAEALDDADPPMEGMSRQVIRITPRWIGSWGLDPDHPRPIGRT